MDRDPPKSKSLGCAIAVAVVISLIVWSVLEAIGIPVSGEAATAVDVPYVGEQLAALDFMTPAAYRCSEHPHGGGTCRIVARATLASVQQFCSQADLPITPDGTSLASREDILEYLQYAKVHIPEDISDTESQVIFGSTGQFIKLYGLYDVPTERLWLSVQFRDS